MQNRLYITTAIDYVNGAPHMGHAFEKIYTDAIARGHRMLGYDVRFQVGTDEHGTKIYQSAKENQMDTQEYVDMNAKKFESLKEKLNLSFDVFVRTSDKEKHWPSVQALWKKLAEAGTLEKRKYTGLYCSGCEAFIPEKDLVDGKCPTHEKAPEKIEEENYFFKLSEFQKEIKAWIENGSIVPDFRAKEILNVIENGLHDVSFSRPRTSLPWGVDVPNDPDQVMYVWCDALTNYISTLGYGTSDESEFEKWWNDAKIVHVIGKDILRFHTAIWPGMLSAAKVRKPDHVLVHGFITSEGKKMSKSLGNVVDPIRFAEENSIDTLRWYLLSEVPMGQDGDFSQTRFNEKYSGELANTIGNLCSRVGMMCEKNLEGTLSGEINQTVQKLGQDLFAQTKVLEEFDIHHYAENVRAHFAKLNAETERLAPWSLAKNGQAEELQNALTSLAQGVYWGAVALAPLMPDIAGKILAQFDEVVPETFEQGRAKKIKTMRKGGILFPRLEK